MTYALKSASLAISLTDQLPSMEKAIVVFLNDTLSFSGMAQSIWNATGLDIVKLAAAVAFTGKSGETIDIPAPHNLDADRLIVLGYTASESVTPEMLRKRGGAVWAKLNALGVQSANIILDRETPVAVAEFAAGAKLRHFSFDEYRTAKSLKPSAKYGPTALKLTVGNVASTTPVLADRVAVADGALLARELVTEPANVLGPVEFADIAKSLTSLGVTVEILEPAQMEALGMGALLGVAQGSRRPARMAIMHWNGDGSTEAPLAFVGKGVCFDTGGISIKPGASMEDMKGDMGGAAAVTGLIKALAGRKAKTNVVGVIGLVENMPDGNAYRPGDILTAMSGTTIEIINTDAEGRLVLADALWYTQDRFKPSAIIDLATLTGAIIVALGNDHAGLFANDDQLASKLLASGLTSGEKLWRMPLGAAYEKLIESRFADIKNSGGRAAGSITAAQFLQNFVNGTPWAHLDIAGPAFGLPSSEIGASWASGFGVALLDQFIRDNYEA